MGSTPLMCSTNGYDYLYSVKRGESLSGIVYDHYGARGRTAAPILASILQQNPEIANPNLIYPGQLISLRYPWDRADSPRSFRAEIQQTKDAWRQATPVEQETMGELGTVYRTLGLSLVGASIPLSSSAALLKSNVQPLEEIATLYNDYRTGSLTKGQYDYARRKILAEFRQRIGRSEKLLFGNRTANQVFRMKPRGGVGATQPMLAQVNRLSKLSKYAARGGVVLTAISLAASCHEIARAPDPVAKNSIAVEAIAGTAAGAAAGVAVGLFLVSNPVGWGVALALGAGTAATGYFAGKAARAVYDDAFREVPVVETLYIDRICR